MSRDRAVAVTLALLLLAYFGGYLGLSDPCRCGMGRAGGATSWVEPNYRVGGGVAERVFQPLELLDRRVRPTFWATRHISYDDKEVAPDPPAD
jgi:hypothetical protein